MVALQILSKVIAAKDNSIIEDNMLTEEDFIEYAAEFNFIQEHIKQYGNVPDKATFLDKFPSIELVDVEESDRYLIDTLREETLYYKSTQVIQKWADMLKTNSNAANEYLAHAMDNLQPNYSINDTDIISQANERKEQFKERKEHQNDWFFESGFEELDDITHGIQREEELVVIVARTNQGKSWVMEKMCVHVWQTGFNVGYFSPEMSPISIGFRFDTLFKQFSNKGLLWGKDDVEESAYNTYIDELTTSNHCFSVTTPMSFNKEVTITKLKNWIKQKKLDMIAIDGITYLTDERAQRGDNKTTSLTNISEDLMTLSMEMKVPILVVVQANRTGVIEKGNDGTPELESIRDSDGIAHNASKVLSIRQKENGVLEIGIKKQRFGPVGGKLNYTWDINEGIFSYIPADGDAMPKERTKEKKEETKKKFSNDKADVF
jgi:replicative DNA helicase